MMKTSTRRFARIRETTAKIVRKNRENVRRQGLLKSHKDSVANINEQSYAPRPSHPALQRKTKNNPATRDDL